MVTWAWGWRAHVSVKWCRWWVGYEGPILKFNIIFFNLWSNSHHAHGIVTIWIKWRVTWKQRKAHASKEVALGWSGPISTWRIMFSNHSVYHASFLWRQAINYKMDDVREYDVKQGLELALFGGLFPCFVASSWAWLPIHTSCFPYN